MSNPGTHQGDDTHGNHHRNQQILLEGSQPRSGCYNMEEGNVLEERITGEKIKVVDELIVRDTEKTEICGNARDVGYNKRWK